MNGGIQVRRRHGIGSIARVLLSSLFFLVALSHVTGHAQTAEWIWSAAPAMATGAAPEVRWFRKPFRTPPYTWNARLSVVASDAAEVYLNGRLVVTCSQAGEPARAEVSMNLIQGDNLLAIRAVHRAGPAALLVHLNLGGTETRQVMSDATWRVRDREEAGWNGAGFNDADWAAVRVLGPHGLAPWGEVLQKAVATPASSLKLLPGFTAELLRSARTDEGSWVCLAMDPEGRLYVSSEGETRPLLRLSLDRAGAVDRVEPVPVPIHFAMGLLFAHGSLYANAIGPSGTGLYRLTDTNHNDRFDADEVRLLKAYKGGGEHGYHALALGPEGRIYVLNGNVTKLPEGLSENSPHRHYGEDILSLNPDETTRAGGALAPGCQILRTDPEGREWELVAAGMRNAYGFDFSPQGELFSVDSDNEWDWGTPWYRPTRLYHCVSGAEMGWRDGTRPWADTYPDMVRSVLDVGIGSPCGVRFGTHARFPAKYREAMFVQDWSYGRILAVHLEPRGASYRGTFEEFLKGQPLNLTSMAFGPDGALYFITGGRGTQSGLYRVRYTGIDSSEQDGPRRDGGTDARAVRHRLEVFHGREDPAAVGVVWPHLGSADVALRYAARVALESQPVAGWFPKALSETNAMTALQAFLAAARVAGPETQPGLLGGLARFPLANLDEELRLLKLRVIELSLIRQGRPSPELVSLATSKLSPRYPASTWAENRELSRLLIWLEAPGVVGRTLDLIDRSPPQEQQIHYIAQLRNLRTGWSRAERERYFQWWMRPRDHLQRPGSLLHWFQDVGRTYVEGANLDRHLESFRRDAIAALPAPDREPLRPLLESPIAGAQLIPSRPREFVRNWTMAELVPDLDRAGSGRDYERGRRAFIDGQCYACHRLGNAGGAIGPEVGALASKYSRREILESLVEPSKVISEQYQNVRLFLKDGDDVTGRKVRESDTEWVIEADPLTRTEQVVRRIDVEEIRASTVSPMPEGLLQVFSQDEIFDLLAFLEAAGRADAPAFRKP